MAEPVSARGSGAPSARRPILGAPTAWGRKTRMTAWLVLQFAVTASVVGKSERVACLNFWDVTERRRAEERLSFLATHDPTALAANPARSTP